MLNFETFREQQLGGRTTLADGWDPTHMPRKVEKPQFIRKFGKVYQVVDGQLIPLHRKSR